MISISAPFRLKEAIADYFQNRPEESMMKKKHPSPLGHGRKDGFFILSYTGPWCK